MAHEAGRRSHPHAMPGDKVHDSHIRAHDDRKTDTHMGNAVKHLGDMHGGDGGYKSNSNALPKPHSTKNPHGV